MPLEQSGGVSLLSGDSLTQQAPYPDKTSADSRRTLTAHPSWGQARACRYVGKVGEMAHPQPLQVGDRVRTIAPIAELPIGVQGIIRALFPMGDLYDVFFHEGIGLRIVHHTKIEPLPSIQDRITPDSA
jgi:hypothetical protein